MSYVSPYSGRNCISYLSCKLFVEKSPSERLELLRGKGLCRQCLTPGVKSGHNKKCYNRYCCKDKSHPKSEEGYHVLVCDLHKNSKNNLSLLELFKSDFIEKFGRNLPQFSKNIKLSFYSESNCVSTPGGQRIIKNQKNKTILMMKQWIGGYSCYNKFL